MGFEQINLNSVNQEKILRNEAVPENKTEKIPQKIVDRENWFMTALDKWAKAAQGWRGAVFPMFVGGSVGFFLGAMGGAMSGHPEQGAAIGAAIFPVLGASLEIIKGGYYISKELVGHVKNRLLKKEDVAQNQ